ARELDSPGIRAIRNNDCDASIRNLAGCHVLRDRFEIRAAPGEQYADVFHLQPVSFRRISSAWMRISYIGFKVNSIRKTYDLTPACIDDGIPVFPCGAAGPGTCGTSHHA